MPPHSTTHQPPLRFPPTSPFVAQKAGGPSTSRRVRPANGASKTPHCRRTPPHRQHTRRGEEHFVRVVIGSSLRVVPLFFRLCHVRLSHMTCQIRARSASGVFPMHLPHSSFETLPCGCEELMKASGRSRDGWPAPVTSGGRCAMSLTERHDLFLDSFIGHETTGVLSSCALRESHHRGRQSQQEHEACDIRRGGQENAGPKSRIRAETLEQQWRDGAEER